MRLPGTDGPRSKQQVLFNFEVEISHILEVVGSSSPLVACDSSHGRSFGCACLRRIVSDMQ